MRYRGSFTVEAALVMPVVLGVIVLFIYSGMFLYDRCTIKSICREACFEGVCASSDPDTAAEGYVQNVLPSRLILEWDTNTEVFSDKNLLTVRITAQSRLFDRAFVHTAKAFKHFSPKY